MGVLDGVLGGAGGFDLGAVAARLGLNEEQVRQGIAALATAAHEHGDTLAAAQAKTGLPLDKLQALLAAVGGESGVAAAGSLLGGGLGGGGGPGGIGGALGGLFGRG